jgi:WXG100 family type VII secretion target
LANYKVNTEVMDGGAADLQRVTTQLEQSMHALEARARSFMAANAGHAIDNYETAQAEWNRGLTEMRTALAQAQRDLLAINDNYIDVDRRNAARMPSGRA